jgi:cold shock CspA family protein
LAKSQQSFGKQERDKKKEKKRQEKLEKKQARKEEGPRSLDDMFAYVDEFGRITDTPPDPTKKKVEVKLEDITLGAAIRSEETVDATRSGRITFFNNDKGFGFIEETGAKDSIFVHISELMDGARELDKVTYEIGSGPKGPVAIKVKKA